MIDIDPMAREMLQAYRAASPLPDSVRRRVLGQLESQMAAGQGAATPEAPSSVRAMKPLSAWAKILVGLSIVVGSLAMSTGNADTPDVSDTVVSTVVADEPPAPSPVAVVPSQVSATVAAAPSAPPIAEGRSSTRPVHRKTRARREPTAAAPPTPDPEPQALEPAPITVDEEVRLVKKAQAELRSGRPQRALDLLAQHQRRFPRGAMAHARDAARVLALCAADRRAQAQREADRFGAAHPGSPYRKRLHGSCVSLDAP